MNSSALLQSFTKCMLIVLIILLSTLQTSCLNVSSGLSSAAVAPTPTPSPNPSQPDVSEPDSSSADYSINGYIQKGPFVLGSEVRIQALDDRLFPTGNVYIVQTTNNLGEFTFEGSLSVNYIEVIISGYYFDEISGGLSLGPLSLKALIPLKYSKGNSRSAERSKNARGAVKVPGNVNILTTLQHSRLKRLFQSGIDFSTAYTQSTEEVLAALRIESGGVGEFSDLNLNISGAGQIELLMASSALLQTAHNRASSTGEITAQLSESLSSIATDIEIDGVLNSNTYTSAIDTALRTVDALKIRRNLNRRYTDLGVSVSIPDFSDLAENPWLEWAELPSALDHRNSAMFEYGGELYFFDFNSANIVKSYNVENETWVAKSSPPSAVIIPVASKIQDSVYVFGGQTSNGGPSSNEVLAYNFENDSWLTKASMPIPLQEHSVAVVNNKAYVFGGYTPGVAGEQPRVFCYDLASDSWTEKSPMTVSRARSTAIAVQDKIYVFGGTEFGMESGAHTFEVYDVAADTWSNLGPMPASSHSMAGAFINGKIYLMAGKEGTWRDLCRNSRSYDPSTGEWEAKTSVPSENLRGYCSQSNRIGAVIGNKFYLQSGTVIYQYDPSKDD